MTDMIKFDFDGEAVRTEERDGEVWFVGRDVCRCLEITNSRDALGRIPDDERERRKGVGSTDPLVKGVRSTHTLGGEQQMVWLREPGLYRLIFESRKPAAERFKKWVFEIVLPTIRKTGAFGVRTLGPDEMVQALGLIREARRVYGVRTARALWPQIGLPVVPEMESIAGSGRPDVETANPELFTYLTDFLSECCEEEATARCSTNELYRAYCRWATVAKAPLVSMMMFSKLMVRTSHHRLKSGGSYYLGLRLKAEVLRRLDGQ